MFKITATQPVSWPELSLVKGDNVFMSRKAVPEQLWPKLDRFRALKILDFEGEASAKNDEPVKLEELTQRQLYDLGKADLAELAAREGVAVAEGASKAILLGALEKRLPVPPKAPAATPELATGANVAPGAGSQEPAGDRAAANRRGLRPTPPAPTGEG